MKYALGLDIGTTSIGWSVVNLDKNRIEDLGVRIFEIPENPKNGESLALPRRTARSARRRLRRRRQRLDYLKQFFIKNDLLDRNQIEYCLSPEHNHEFNPYALREKGLTERLLPQELFVALYHIAKRRGYKSNRRSVEENDSESGKVLAAIKSNSAILAKYQTIGEALNKDDFFKDRKRNKHDDYRNSFIREQFYDEVKKILEKQQQFYSQLSDSNIKLLLMGDVDNGNKNGIFYQRPFMTDELINKMRGNCQYEKREKRAPKASYSFEMFRLAQDLANLTYTLNFRPNDERSWKIAAQRKGEAINLTEEEIAKCVNKCKETGNVTYRAIRNILGYKEDPAFEFTYIRGKDPKNDNETQKDSQSKKQSKFTVAKEKNTFANLKFYHGVKNALKDLPDDWNNIESNVDLFDKIGEVLSCNKDDKSISEGLSKLNISHEAVNELLKLNYAGFGHLSIKALRKITPYLLKGNGVTYDKAVEEAGYRFSAKLSGDKQFLPPLNEQDSNQITNPIVKRAISQTIKVVNAIIRKYGQPCRIGLECASELSKNFKDRKDIEKRQNENAAVNEEIIASIKKDGIVAPNGLLITKIKFYREQDGKCLYSGKEIKIDQLINDPSYCQIDHIIPWSRCGNDSRSNKALVLNKCNQEKGNRTPYEAWGNNETFWREFESRVNANPKLSPTKKKRLLATSQPKESWRDHALNDTRYISAFMQRYLRDHLAFSKERDDKQRVIVPNGSVTAFLRRMWHIPNKDREANNLHHAIDATVIALVTQDKIADCAKYSAWLSSGEKIRLGGDDTSAGSLKFAKMLDEITDHVTGDIDKERYRKLQESFMPWPEFDKEIKLRVSQPKENDNLAIWRDQFRDLYAKFNDDREFLNSIHPIFVSRMPKRGGKGQAHKETLRSPKTKDNDGLFRATRMKLTDITLKDLENSKTAESDKVLYEQLKRLLMQYDGDPKKAFAEPVYKNGVKFDKSGKPISPVTTIKVYSKQPDSSGFYLNNASGRYAYVNNGNGSMTKVDVYSRKNNLEAKKYYIVPIYARQVHTGSKTILPKPKKDIPQEIDATFTKETTLYPNDYVICTFKDKETGSIVKKEIYYKSFDINGNKLEGIPHTSVSSEQRLRIAPMNAVNIKRLDINVLGDNYPWE